MYPWYRDSVAAAAAAGLGGPVGVVGSGFCSTGPGQGATTIKTESGYSDCMLALDYVQSKVSEYDLTSFFRVSYIPRFARSDFRGLSPKSKGDFGLNCLGLMFATPCNV